MYTPRQVEDESFKHDVIQLWKTGDELVKCLKSLLLGSEV